MSLMRCAVERLLVCVGVLFGAGDVAADYGGEVTGLCWGTLWCG
jgi:hypothetical protein